MGKFKKWLNDATIRKKFVPLQWFVIINVIIISVFSFGSIVTVNISSQRIIDENVRNKEMLSSITRNMYVCRVLGRDILLAQDEDVKMAYYDNYINAFNELDEKMNTFSEHLSGDQLTEFTDIIEQKNTYKESMILSADIWIQEGEYEDALYALQVVTPIANEFFGSIDEFSTQEEIIMNEALDGNDALVLTILIVGGAVCLIMIFGVISFTRFFSKSMSESLIRLEEPMSQIAETGNMKIEIPKDLYTKDEIGRIAYVANDMKMMLLEYSFTDSLTGGLNAKAYYEELDDLFNNEDVVKEFWCIIADMNNLKVINDNLGHLDGDNALRNSFHYLNANLKQYGKTFRIGGDEFVSLLTGCDEMQLKEMLKKIEEQISSVNTNQTFKYSLAFGYGKFSGKTMDSYSEFFRIVDKRMYDNKVQSKQARLNARVVLPPEIQRENKSRKEQIKNDI